MDRILTAIILRLGRTRFADSTRIFEMLGDRLNIDHLQYAHKQRGILNWQSPEVSGETFVVEKLLPAIIPSRPICFDVGGNKGDYSRMLLRAIPDAKVTVFEPNSRLAGLLNKELGDRAQVVSSALGDRTGTIQLFNGDDDTTSHGSVYRDVLDVLHRHENVSSEDVPITTLDAFCTENDVRRIDFLKIDTEGNELNVLKGASQLLSDQKVGTIQFEFNEMNVISRVFLKDFFDILTGFTLYRLNGSSLLPLKYHPREELFQYQNIVATTIDIPSTLRSREG